MASQIAKDIHTNDENVMPENLKKRVLRPRPATNIPVPKRSALSVINNVPATKTGKSLGIIKKTNIPVPVKNVIPPPAVPAPNITKPSSTTFSIFSDETAETTSEVADIPQNRVKLYKPEPLQVNAPEAITPDTETEDESSPMTLDTSDEDATHHFQNTKIFMLSVYSYDIYRYLQQQETKFRPNPNYISKQPDINMSMRSILIDWLVEVAGEYKMHTETLYLAISYIDRFLSHMSVLKSKLQLVGTASMFIASKYEEIYPPELKDFVYITDDTYTKRQVLKMEHLILKVLAFDVSVPTAYYFLHHICTIAGMSDKIRYLAQYICELSLLESVPFLAFLPSELAASSLCLALYTLEQAPWTEELKDITGYSIEALVRCISALYKQYSTIDKHAQQAITGKYRSSKYMSVSNITPPQEMNF